MIRSFFQTVVKAVVPVTMKTWARKLKELAARPTALALEWPARRKFFDNGKSAGKSVLNSNQGCGGLWMHVQGHAAFKYVATFNEPVWKVRVKDLPSREQATGARALAQELKGQLKTKWESEESGHL